MAKISNQIWRYGHLPFIHGWMKIIERSFIMNETSKNCSLQLLDSVTGRAELGVPGVSTYLGTPIIWEGL